MVGEEGDEGGRWKKERVLGKNALRGYHGRLEPEKTTQIAMDDKLAFASIPRLDFAVFGRDENTEYLDAAFSLLQHPPSLRVTPPGCFRGVPTRGSRLRQVHRFTMGDSYGPVLPSMLKYS
jgi:hypothetical protein